VFDAIASHCWTNEPAWEPEVIGVKADAGGLRVGGRAVMTRRENGKTLDTTYEITVLDGPRHIALAHLDGPMRFALAWDVVPAGADAADVTVTVNIALHGAMRLLTPLIALGAPGRNASISAAMVRSIESATPAAGAMPVAV
jgi:hypothetical protein